MCRCLTATSRYWSARRSSTILTEDASMPEAATRRVPTVPSAGWMRPLPPALRLILQADAGARATAVKGWRATLWQAPDEYLLLVAPFSAEGAPPSDAESDSALVDALERALESVP